MIKVKNHEKCKVIDNGDVSVMINMSRKLIWKHVRHVPEFRLNLMLVRGFASYFTNGVRKLVKSSLIVVRRNKLCNYYRIVL